MILCYDTFFERKGEAIADFREYFALSFLDSLRENIEETYYLILDLLKNPDSRIYSALTKNPRIPIEQKLQIQIYNAIIKNLPAKESQKRKLYIKIPENKEAENSKAKTGAKKFRTAEEAKAFYNIKIAEGEK